MILNEYSYTEMMMKYTYGGKNSGYFHRCLELQTNCLFAPEIRTCHTRPERQTEQA